MSASRRTHPLSAAGLLVLSLTVIAAGWSWIGRLHELPASPEASGEKLPCVSYTPFRGGESPLHPDGATVTPEEIETDLAHLAVRTRCVRTYSSVGFNLDLIPAIAAKHGLEVLQGIWLSSDPVANRREIDAGVALAGKHPRTIRALVVGNEVLLRRELTPEALSAHIRDVRARAPVPVTYADVWEFWLLSPALADAVDFVTVHILPYWENHPASTRAAAQHVADAYATVQRTFPGKKIFVGEFGWPSAGRMREQALPSPVNQARVLNDVLAWAAEHGADINLIEAFDQPWKRALEGTVGGYWGLFDSETRQPKFVWGRPLSNHPWWPWQALLGSVLAALVFAAAWRAATAEARESTSLWIATSAMATAAGLLAGLGLEALWLAADGIGGRLRLAGFGAVALTAPLAAAAMAAGRAIPSFAEVLGEDAGRHGGLARAAGLALALTTLCALQVALTLVFNGRYTDFPFAALSAAILPFAIHAAVVPARRAAAGSAEVAAAGVLALSAFFFMVSEGAANWQALWLGGVLLTLAALLVRHRPGPAKE